MLIAIIGVGVAGLVSLKRVVQEVPHAKVVAFEVSSDIGGVWGYTDEVGADKYGLPIAKNMYKNLRINLPKQVMQFSDYPAPPGYKTFAGHEDFYAYLQDYVDRFDLRRHILFEHLVTLVKPANDAWDVTYEDLKANETHAKRFDYVFVCNGHYAKQFTPFYEGRDDFRGSQIHSSQYRIPDPYKDKRVLIVGSGPSGLDISIDVAKVAKEVYLSHHRKPFKSPFPPNYHQRPSIEKLSEDSVTFVDGSREQIDSIIFCTGYSYDCPFLDPSCNVTVERTRMLSLYKHIVNVEHPSMFFIGVPQLCCTVRMIEMQAKYTSALISGKFKLPSKRKMLDYIEMDCNRKNQSIHKTERKSPHILGRYEPMYYSDLSEESGLPPVPSVLSAIRASTIESRSNLYAFRDYDFHIIDDEHFVRTFNGTSPDETLVKNTGKCWLEYSKTANSIQEPPSLKCEGA